LCKYFSVKKPNGPNVDTLLKEIRHNPMLWLLALVPVALVAAKLAPAAHTLLFVLSVLAIMPLAALLSHATESVAEKTGDAAGGLLNATLGNLTELVIAVAALRAGEYALVKGSIAGAIVTNTLFMLGASFFLGGLKHHIQEYNRATARLDAALLFLATIALVSPSAIAKADLVPGAALTQKLSVALALLLIVGCALGLRFSLKTHREIFAEDEGRVTLKTSTRTIKQHLLKPYPTTCKKHIGTIRQFSFWGDLPVYLQMTVEKIDLKNLSNPVCKEFHIRLLNISGWGDINSRAGILRRFAKWHRRGKRGVLLHCGDHEPGGLHIFPISFAAISPTFPSRRLIGRSRPPIASEAMGTAPWIV
jgi:Ca2+/Na+ antiporter